jgi:hypothetical protein
MLTVAGYGAPAAAARRRGPLPGRVPAESVHGFGPARNCPKATMAANPAAAVHSRALDRDDAHRTPPGLGGRSAQITRSRQRQESVRMRGRVASGASRSRRGRAVRVGSTSIPGLVSDNLLGAVLAQLSGMGRDARRPVSTLSPRHRLAGSDARRLMPAFEVCHYRLHGGLSSHTHQVRGSSLVVDSSAASSPRFR